MLYSSSRSLQCSSCTPTKRSLQSDAMKVKLYCLATHKQRRASNCCLQNSRIFLEGLSLSALRSTTTIKGSNYLKRFDSQCFSGKNIVLALSWECRTQTEVKRSQVSAQLLKSKNILKFIAFVRSEAGESEKGKRKLRSSRDFRISSRRCYDIIDGFLIHTSPLMTARVCAIISNYRISPSP